jgi:hypothetical protein
MDRHEFQFNNDGMHVRGPNILAAVRDGPAREDLAGTCRGAFFPFRFTRSHSSADTTLIFPVQWASLFLPFIFLGTASG